MNLKELYIFMFFMSYPFDSFSPFCEGHITVK